MVSTCKNKHIGGGPEGQNKSKNCQEHWWWLPRFLFCVIERFKTPSWEIFGGLIAGGTWIGGVKQQCSNKEATDTIAEAITIGTNIINLSIYDQYNN